MHPRFELEMVLSGASKRGTRNDQLHRHFFPLRPDLQHFHRSREPRLGMDRHRPVICSSIGRLGPNRRDESKDLRHDPQDDKILVSVGACEQHSGNRPCQHDRGLARYCRLRAAHHSRRANPAFDQFTAALPIVTHPRRRRLDLIARSGFLAPPPLSPPLLGGLFFMPRPATGRGGSWSKAVAARRAETRCGRASGKRRVSRIRSRAE